MADRQPSTQSRRSWLPSERPAGPSELRAEGYVRVNHDSSAKVSFVKGHSLSVAASRLLALMISTADRDGWQDRPERVRIADLCPGNESAGPTGKALEELHRTLFAVRVVLGEGKETTSRFPMISSSLEEFTGENGANAGWIEWKFSPHARKLLRDTESRTVFRQAVLGFRSRYALMLYEIGASRLHRGQTSWKGDMAALRALLGIRTEVYKDFAQLRRKVLQTAKAEIDQLAHFRMNWNEVRFGRTIMGVEIWFEPKEVPE